MEKAFNTSLTTLGHSCLQGRGCQVAGGGFHGHTMLSLRGTPCVPYSNMAHFENHICLDKVSVLLVRLVVFTNFQYIVDRLHHVCTEHCIPQAHI